MIRDTIGRADKQRYEEDQKQLQAVRMADLIDQMDTPKGRRFVWGMLKSMLYQTPITDTNASVYGKVAKQAVAIELAKELKACCRDLFYTMEIENDGLGG